MKVATFALVFFLASGAFGQTVATSFRASPSIDQLQVLQLPSLDLDVRVPTSGPALVVGLRLAPLLVLNEVALKLGASLPLTEDGVSMDILGAAGVTVGFLGASQVTALYSGEVSFHKRIDLDTVSLDVSVGVSRSHYGYASSLYWGVPIGIGWYW